MGACRVLDFERPTRDEQRAAQARAWAEQDARASRFRGPYLNHDECRARYPRLARAMQWAAILSTTEAGSALREYRAGWLTGGCEAVAHFGGPLAVIRAGVRCRRVVRALQLAEAERRR